MKVKKPMSQISYILAAIDVFTIAINMCVFCFSSQPSIPLRSQFSTHLKNSGQVT